MMLKKSLLAISLAAAVGTVHATTTPSSIDAGGNIVPVINPKGFQLASAQGNLSTIDLGASGVSDPAFKVGTITKTLSDYATLDKVKVTFTGATISASSAVDADLNATKLDAAKVTFPDANTIVYDTAVKTGQTIAAANLFTFAGVVLATDGKTDISMTVEVISTIAGVVIDSATSTIVDFRDEFSAKVSGAGAGDVFGDILIDVGVDRKNFVGGTAKTDAIDTAAVTLSDLAVDHGDVSASVDPGDTVVTLKGSLGLGYLDQNADGDLADTKDGSVTATFAGSAIAATYVKADQTAQVKPASANGEVTFTLTSTGLELKPQEFTVDVATKYTSTATVGGTATTSGIKVGSWKYNGSSTDIAYLPFGSAYAHSITVTNLSGADGEITVSLTSGGETTDAVSLGMAKGKSVTQIGKEVAALAAAEGFTEAGVNITVNAKQIEVVGIYYSKADGDRVLTK